MCHTVTFGWESVYQLLKLTTNDLTAAAKWGHRDFNITPLDLIALCVVMSNVIWGQRCGKPVTSFHFPTIPSRQPRECGKYEFFMPVFMYWKWSMSIFIQKYIIDVLWHPYVIFGKKWSTLKRKLLTYSRYRYIHILV